MDSDLLTTTYPELYGRQVAFFGDIENLIISARNDGRRLLLNKLAIALRNSSQRTSLRAILTTGNKQGLSVALARYGYYVIRVRGKFGMRDASDHTLCFEAGRMVADGGFDAVVIGSGDGPLVLAVADGVKRLRPEIKVFSFAFRSSASHLITAPCHQRLFDGHIWANGEITTPLQKMRHLPDGSGWEDLT